MALTTPTTPTSWHPDQYVYPAREAMPSALYHTATTVSGAIEGDAPALRIARIADAAASFVDEYGEIPESDPSLNELTVFTRKVGLLTSVSSEQYRQQGADVRLSDSVIRSVTRAADEALISQPAPTAPAVAPAPGLVNWPGATTATVTGVPGLIDAAAAVEDAGGNLDMWVCSPLTWATLSKFTAYAAQAIALGSGAEDAPRRILGRNVVVNKAVPAGKMLGIDREAVVSAVGPVRVATSEHHAFSREGVTLRCTWRVGHTVTDPARLVVVTVTDPA